MFWTQKDGTIINVTEMTDQHIINSIKWLTNDTLFGELNKDNKSDIEWVSILSDELFQRRVDASFDKEED